VSSTMFSFDWWHRFEEVWAKCGLDTHAFSVFGAACIDITGDEPSAFLLRWDKFGEVKVCDYYQYGNEAPIFSADRGVWNEMALGQSRIHTLFLSGLIRYVGPSEFLVPFASKVSVLEEVAIRTTLSMPK
jgi:hypothetical protein